MEGSSQQNMVIVISLLFLAGIILYSRYGKHRDKDWMGMIFGISSRKKTETEEETKKKPSRPKEKNDTKTELTLFASELLKTASRNGMRVVMPGIVDYKGESSRLTAFLISPRGITGVYCLGFGGSIRAGEGEKPWKQFMNGEEKQIENPIVVCRQQQELVEAAMREAGIFAELEVVAVFTNSAVKLSMNPSALVYTKKDFLAHIKDTDALKRGSLDVEKATKDMAALADIEGRKEAVKRKKKK